MGKDRYANLIECSSESGLKVYLAHDTVLDRDVELKIFPWSGRDFAESSETDLEAAPIDPRLSQFFREARAMSLLEHPAVPTVLDAGRWDDTDYYYALRLARGEPLRKVLAREETRAGRLRLLSQFTVACRAVAYAHTRGVVHRHLTPSAIVIGPYGDVFVEGWSRAWVSNGSRTAATENDIDSGHPEFLAPEIRGGATGDKRSDVYSLGAILYVILSGQAPPPNIDSVPAANLSDELGAVCRRAMAFDPEGRYESVDDLLVDLAPNAGVASPNTPIVDERRRHRAALRRKKNLRNTAGSAALIVLVALAAYRFWPERSEWAVETQPPGRSPFQAGAFADAMIAQNLDARKPVEIAHAELISWADTVAAATSLADGNIAATRESLARIPDTQRHWEWGYLERAINRDRLTIDAADVPLISIAIAPDGKSAVAAGQEKVAREWSLETGELMRTYEGHRSELRIVTISPSGRYMVTAGWDRTAIVWERGTGQPVARYEGHDRAIWAVAIAPDESWAASAGDDGLIDTWDMLSGQPVERLFDNDSRRPTARFRASRSRIWTLAFSPDGRYLAAGDMDGVITILDLQDRRNRRVVETRAGLVTGLDIDPESAVLWASFYNGEVRTYSVSTGAETGRIHVSDAPVWSIRLSSDGSVAVSVGRDGNVMVWDATSEAKLARIVGHASDVSAAAIASDGTTLVTADYDGIIKLWSIDDFIRNRAEPGELAATTLPCSQQLKLTTDGAEFLAVAIEPPGEVAASGGDDSSVTLWDLRNGEVIDTLWSRGNRVAAATFNVDGSSLAVGWREGTVDVWDIESRSIKRRIQAAGRGFRRNMSGLAFSEDGMYLAVGMGDGQVTVWDLEANSRDYIFDAHTSSTAALAFHPYERRLATGGSSGRIRIWDEASQPGPFLELEGHERDIRDLAFSPGGAYLLSASDDRAIRLWNPAEGVAARVIHTHTGPVTSVAFSPDGKRVLSSGEDGAVRLWDVTNARPTISLDTGGHPIETARFTTVGTGIVAASLDGAVFRWEAFPWDEAAYPGDSSMTTQDRIERMKRTIPIDQNTR